MRLSVQSFGIVRPGFKPQVPPACWAAVDGHLSPGPAHLCDDHGTSLTRTEVSQYDKHTRVWHRACYPPNAIFLFSMTIIIMIFVSVIIAINIIII